MNHFFHLFFFFFLSSYYSSSLAIPSPYSSLFLSHNFFYFYFYFSIFFFEDRRGQVGLFTIGIHVWRSCIFTIYRLAPHIQHVYTGARYHTKALSTAKDRIVGSKLPRLSFYVYKISACSQHFNLVSNQVFTTGLALHILLI